MPIEPSSTNLFNPINTAQPFGQPQISLFGVQPTQNQSSNLFNKPQTPQNSTLFNLSSNQGLFNSQQQLPSSSQPFSNINSAPTQNSMGIQPTQTSIFGNFSNTTPSSNGLNLNSGTGGGLFKMGK